jgi:hypothetical protein
MTVEVRIEAEVVVRELGTNHAQAIQMTMVADSCSAKLAWMRGSD